MTDGIDHGTFCLATIKTDPELRSVRVRMEEPLDRVSEIRINTVSGPDGGPGMILSIVAGGVEMNLAMTTRPTGGPGCAA